MTTEPEPRTERVESPPESGDGEPWYRAGLRFACTRCGHCCSGTPGTVRVTDDEIGTLAQRTGLADAEFRAVYTRRLRRGEISLREKSGGECILFDPKGGCSVYSARPRQCRSWPFWAAVVHSPERWAEEAKACPGMNRGPLHTADHIARRSAADGTGACAVPRRSEDHPA